MENVVQAAREVEVELDAGEVEVAVEGSAASADD